MEFRGTFEDGVVRPDEPVHLPSGTRVEFQPIHDGAAVPLSEAELRARHDQFWKGPNIEDLVRARGDMPLASASDLLGAWPDEADDVEEFLRFLREIRK
jgi:predicted DNA-binding antitoxin AbrB/MazE fold protein